MINLNWLNSDVDNWDTCYLQTIDATSEEYNTLLTLMIGIWSKYGNGREIPIMKYSNLFDKYNIDKRVNKNTPLKRVSDTNLKWSSIHASMWDLHIEALYDEEPEEPEDTEKRLSILSSIWCTYNKNQIAHLFYHSELVKKFSLVNNKEEIIRPIIEELSETPTLDLNWSYDHIKEWDNSIKDFNDAEITFSINNNFIKLAKENAKSKLLYLWKIYNSKETFGDDILLSYRDLVQKLKIINENSSNYDNKTIVEEQSEASSSNSPTDDTSLYNSQKEPRPYGKSISQIDNSNVPILNNSKNSLSGENKNSSSSSVSLVSTSGSILSNTSSFAAQHAGDIAKASTEQAIKHSTIGNALSYLLDPFSSAIHLKEAASLSSTANLMGTVSKAIPVVGAVAGIGSDIYRDRRIGKLEDNVTKNIEKIKEIDVFQKDLGNFSNNVSKALSKIVDVTNIGIKEINSHTSKFIEHDDFKDKMLQELDDHGEVIQTIIAKTGIDVNLDKMNKTHQELLDMQAEFKRNDEIRKQESDKRWEDFQRREEEREAIFQQNKIKIEEDYQKRREDYEESLKKIEKDHEFFNYCSNIVSDYLKIIPLFGLLYLIIG